MPNSLRSLGVSDADLEREIQGSAEVRRAQIAKAEEMAAYAKSIAPKDTGNYAAQIEVKKKGRKVRVGAMAWYSHFIEYGTGPDTKEGSPFGPNTETPEFAVMARTAAAFGGTSDGQDGEGR